jgi:hypothetical protein
MACQSGLAVVELGGGAGVQADRGAALAFGDRAGLEVGEQVLVDAHPKLDRDGDALGGSDGGADDRARAGRGLSGIAAPPPLRVTLRTGQPKFMSM